jgi:predicted phospho-2-dehydro-3-deoxyheptonate aldolase
MTVNEKKNRLAKICHEPTGRFVIVPMDHGVSSGPIAGIIDIADTIEKVGRGGATAVVLHKGIIKTVYENFKDDLGFILHVSASTKLSPDPDAKVLIATVEEAQKLGAQCVSIHVNVGARTEDQMLRDLGFVSRACREAEIPLLAMMYPRGPHIKNPFDVELVKHVARLGAELGADIIKTNYTGSVDTFREVTKGCPKPVVIAGGPKVDSDRDVLQMVYDAMKAGCMGVSIGRNVFQHENITGITKAISGIVLKDLEIDEAYKLISGR